MSGRPTADDVRAWAAEADAVGERIGRHSARAEPRRRAVEYLRGLLSDVERKNGWQLAERAGDATPHGVQHLLGRADWDADAVRGDLTRYAHDAPADPDGVAKPILPDELWAKIEPLLPKPKRRRFRHPGRKPLAPRRALTGILFVLRTGIRWNDLPSEMGCGSGNRCRRYLKAWHRAGVWTRLHAVLLAELDDAGKIDWSRAAVDGSLAWALGGGEDTGPSPVDRGRKGSKRHAVVDPHSTPLGATTTAANVPDVSALPEVVDAVPVVKGKRGRRKRRPRKLYADRGYDSDRHRRRMRRRGIDPKFARRRTAHGSGLGKCRWPVERLFAWLHRYRRLRLRTDRTALMHNAFLKLAVRLICFNLL